MRHLRRQRVSEVCQGIQGAPGQLALRLAARPLQPALGETRKLETSLHRRPAGKSSCVQTYLQVNFPLVLISFFNFQAGLDRTILLNFIQLRSDYKTQKLANSLRGFAT